MADLLFLTHVRRELDSRRTLLPPVVYSRARLSPENVEMNHDEAISFYSFEKQSRLRRGDQPVSGWDRCVIYKGRHWKARLGVVGNMFFIKLSDGRVVLTNDLWFPSDNSNRVTPLPQGYIVGYRLNTKNCLIKTKAALEALLSIVKVREDGHFSTMTGLSDQEAYALPKHYAQLPTCGSRKYENGPIYGGYLPSPEGAVLTHFKIGSRPVEPLLQMEQLWTHGVSDSQES